MRHSNIFYILTNDGFHPEKKAIPLPNKAGLDLFRVDYTISDGKTGQKIKENSSKESMEAYVKKIEDDTVLRERIEAAIAAAIEQKGSLSPRYTRPDEKHEDVFPAKPSKSGRSKSTEAQRDKKRQEQQAMYETAIYNAEQAILNHESVDDTVVKGTSLLLSLFKENGIDISPNVRSWVTSSLYGLDFDASLFVWQFRHRGSFKTAFRTCFDRLVIAIERKYADKLPESTSKQ